MLTGEDLIDGDLSGLELAVLSACETGLRDAAGDEGVTGLDSGQELGDFAHVGQFNPRKPARLAWRAIEAERAL